MRDHVPFYPLKVVSRSLPATRTNRLRVSWFALGLLAGIGFSLTFSSGLSPFLEQTPAVVSSTFEAVEETVAELKDAPDGEVDTPEEIVAEEAPAPGEVEAETAAAAPPETIYPLTLTLTVENGDTLINMLIDAGASYEEAHNVVSAMRKKYDPKKLSVGKSMALELDKNPNAPDKAIVTSLVLPLSVTSSIEVRRKDDGSFEAQKMQVPVTRTVKRAAGTIESSLYETGVGQGLSPALLSELITAYSYDVDFQRDIQRGHKMDVLFERMETEEGIPAGYGNILYAELKMASKSLKIYHFTDKEGDTDYYNSKGESVRKALLRTPVNGAKITSRFGKRRHPILGYNKMHRGVDFGAPTGTPVYAAGDGVIDYAGRKGGYGNYVRIKHNGTYSTAYAHLSKFASGIGNGRKVKQGQIIAYVGSTGMSTGPHLHYEVLQRGQQVNPSSVKFKTGKVLAGNELKEFKKNIEHIEAQLASSKHERLAMNKNPEKSVVP